MWRPDRRAQYGPQLAMQLADRLFRAQLGMSPGRFVERSRLETARRCLEERAADRGVGGHHGFGSAGSLRRVFVHPLWVSPAEYRRRFGHLPRSA